MIHLMSSTSIPHIAILVILNLAGFVCTFKNPLQDHHGKRITPRYSPRISLGLLATTATVDLHVKISPVPRGASVGLGCYSVFQQADRLLRSREPSCRREWIILEEY